MFHLMKVGSFQQWRIHDSLDLFPQAETELDGEGDEDQPRQTEDEAEDHERPGVLDLQVSQDSGPESQGRPAPCQQEDGREGEAADHVFVWASLH